MGGGVGRQSGLCGSSIRWRWGGRGSDAAGVRAGDAREGLECSSYIHPPSFQPRRAGTSPGWLATESFFGLFLSDGSGNLLYLYLPCRSYLVYLPTDRAI